MRVVDDAYARFQPTVSEKIKFLQFIEDLEILYYESVENGTPLNDINRLPVTIVGDNRIIETFLVADLTKAKYTFLGPDRR